jgi:hypothetical protein
VIGRDGHLDAGEKQRLSWRNDKVAVNTKKILCMTFDELLSLFSTRLGALTAVETFASAAAAATSGKASSSPAPRKKPRTGKP